MKLRGLIVLGLLLLPGVLYATSVVSIDLNPQNNPQAFLAKAGTVNTYGASSAYANGSYDLDPYGPTGWATLTSNITSSDGANGAVITWTGWMYFTESNNYGAQVNCDFTIGTSSQYPAGRSLKLNLLLPSFTGSFSVYRNGTYIPIDHDPFYAMYTKIPDTIDVFAGETLKLMANFDAPGSDAPETIQLSMWTVVPEPATLGLLALGTMAIIRRKK